MSAYFNQAEISDAKFDSLTRSFVKNKHSHGVIETMQIDNSQGLHLKQRHLARLLRGIESLQSELKIFKKLDLNTIAIFFEQDIRFFMTQFKENHLSSVAIRYQIILDEKNPDKLIRMIKARSVVQTGSNKIKIKICKTYLPENTSLQGRKDIDRSVYDKAAKEIDKRFYDGILCDEKGHVIEGTKTNLFAVKNDKLYTPCLSKGGVAGIMRQVFIERAQETGLNVIIAPLHYLQLMTMDAVFLTNSIIGVVKVDYILRPDRKRSVNVFKPESRGFQNILQLNLLSKQHLYKRVKTKT